MADRGITFAGDGKMDVTMDKSGTVKSTSGLPSGGPVKGPPETNTGASTDAPVKPANAMGGGKPSGGNIKFAGDVGMNY